MSQLRRLLPTLALAVAVAASAVGRAANVRPIKAIEAHDRAAVEEAPRRVEL